MTPTPTIFWFRRDLRLGDHTALLAALRAGSGTVVPVFVADPLLLASVGPARAAYLRATLGRLDRSLAGNLTLRVGSPREALAEIAREVGAREVFATADFSPFARGRDQAVASALITQGIQVHFLDSPYVVPPGTLFTRANTPIQVFTSFRRAWEVQALPNPLPPPENVTWIRLAGSPVSVVTELSAKNRPDYFGDLPDHAPAFDARTGEAGARATLDAFLTRVERYDEERDRPALDGTSRLSPHLHFGTVHPRQVLAATNGPSRGAEVFRSEIAWREFYADVLFHQPASRWRSYRPSFEHLRVDTDDLAISRFQAWARGETGYPLVDAGMRQLLTEGWMHNRVRMVTASFLIKHLHVDWRWGAQWFMWRLIDADVASNQHGWQWVAGSGTDAAPFYRIFNPNRQATSFDPEGRYIQRYVSELRGIPAPECLSSGATLTGYPSPIIDLGRERSEALARFSEIRSPGALPKR